MIIYKINIELKKKDHVIRPGKQVMFGQIWDKIILKLDAMRKSKAKYEKSKMNTKTEMRTKHEFTCNPKDVHRHFKLDTLSTTGGNCLVKKYLRRGQSNANYVMIEELRPDAVKQN